MSLGRTWSSPSKNKSRGHAAGACDKFSTLQPSHAKSHGCSELFEVAKQRSMSRKRRKILNEIFETEKSYRRHLSLLTNLFLDPIRSSNLLPGKVIEIIFGNIEAIKSLNALMLELMDTEGVVHALLKVAPYMKIYSIYANNFDKANKVLEEWEKKNADLRHLICSQERIEEMQGLKLRALLITPIQRVPRYRLLLEALLEKTLENDLDYPKLKEACGEISKVANHINECVRQHENFQKMLAIQNSFTGDGAPKILAPGRLFLREGVLNKVTEKGTVKERTFYLFNDILICSKKETSCTYTCRDVFPLVNCLVEHVLGSAADKERGGLFKVLCHGRSLLLYATSVDGSASWADDIKNAISVLHTNLASLRRGEDDPFSQPGQNFEEDLRWSQKAKNRLSKNLQLTPLRILSCAASPSVLGQDTLFPMREEMLPALASDTVNKKSYEYSLQEKPTGCFDSAKKAPSSRKRRHVEEEKLPRSISTQLFMSRASSGSSNSSTKSSSGSCNYETVRDKHTGLGSGQENIPASAVDNAGYIDNVFVSESDSIPLSERRDSVNTSREAVPGCPVGGPHLENEEVFASDLKASTEFANWTLSDPEPIERRRGIHDKPAQRESGGGKLTCASLRRRERMSSAYTLNIPKSGKEVPGRNGGDAQFSLPSVEPCTQDGKAGDFSCVLM